MINPIHSVLGATMRHWLGALLLAVCVALPGTSYAFHFPWDQGHDTTDWDDPNDPGPCEGPNCDPCNSTSSPVYFPTGHFVWGETDIAMPGRQTLQFSRTYNSHDARSGLLGNGWTIDGDVGLFETTSGTQRRFVLRMSNGKRYTYTRASDGTVVAPAGRFDTIRVGTTGDLQLANPDGSYMSFDSRGRLVRKVDANGIGVNYIYAANSPTPERISDDAGRFISFAYNASGRISSITDHAGRSWSYDYDTNGNLSGVTDPGGATTQYTYQVYIPPGDGHTYYHLTRITNPTAVIVSDVVYSGERVQSYTVGANRYTYSYNPSARTTTKTDQLNSRWTYIYDVNGQLVEERDPLNATRRFSYDVNGLMTQVTDELNRIWPITYDANGRKRTEADPLGNITTWSYEGTRPQPTGVLSPTGRTTTLAYDARGNLQRVTDPSGAATQIQWSASGAPSNAIDAAGNTTTVVSDSFGRPSVVTDPQGRETRFTFDAAGNLQSIANASAQLVDYEYDALGRIIRRTDPGGVTTRWDYDAAGRVESVTDASGSVTGYLYDTYGRLRERVGADGRREQYTYRLDNRVQSVTLANGTTVSYEYDAAKRMSSQTTGSLTTSYTYNARDQILAATNAVSTISFTYDEAGLLQTETLNGQTVTYARNAEGERTGVSTSTGYTASFERNALGLITAINSNSGRYEIEYDALGRRHLLTLPNGSSAEYFYSTGNQLTRIVHSGAFNAQFGYEYNTQGLLSRFSGSDFDWQYQYTADQQLTSAVSGTNSFTYAYDAGGNRTGAAHRYEANRLMEDQNFLFNYDALGNLQSKQHKVTGERTAYQWNALNQLVQVQRFDSPTGTIPVSTTAYAYDALGRRFRKTTDGVVERYLFSAQDPIVALDGSGNVLANITFGPAIDEVLGVSTGAGATYFHKDHQGSAMALSNAAGAIVGAYRYSPFGETLQASGTANAFRYTGREADADDLYFYRSRYYDPTIGRYLSPDTIGFRGGDTNLYRYVGNNPVNLTDPSGQILPAIALVWAGIEIGLAIYDAYDTASTLLDPCTSGWEKALAGGLFVAGALLPGGGYSAADDVGKAAIKGCCCFGEGTLVRTDKGMKPIEYIERGDQVASWNQERQELEYKTVNQLFLTEGKTLYRVTLEDHAGKSEQTFVSADHPYRVVDGDWTPVRLLKPGMPVQHGSAGDLVVRHVEMTERNENTYNISVADNSTYFVGQQQALVHNCSCKLNIGNRIPDSDLKAPPSKRGNAPIGQDGHPVELHHRDQTSGSPVDEMTRTDHRLGDNYKENHSNTGQQPSNIDREQFRKDAREYWQQEWDRGRFNNTGGND